MTDQSQPRKARAPRRPTIRQTLTDRFISSLPAAPKNDRTVVYDTIVKGFAVSVTDKGHRSFILYARYPGERGGRPAKLALGSVDVLSLKNAREKAREWLELIGKGKDPQEEARRQQEAERLRRKTTFGSAAEDFIVHIQAKEQRKAKQVEREIRRELLPHWATKPITDISAGDLKMLVERLARRAPYVAHAVYGEVRSIFNFAIASGEYGVTTSPCDRLKPKYIAMARKKSRERTLTDDELRAYWKATEKLGYPYGPFYRLLLLTGQRLNEVAGARWREFDLEANLWTIPAERFKSDHTQTVPLSAPVLKVLEELPRFADEKKDKRDLLFSTTGGHKAINGFSKAAYLLRKHMATELDCNADDLRDRTGSHAFVIHDVRRTVRTRLSAFVSREVAELVIGHTIKGLQKVYDRHNYLDERRAALDAWAKRLLAIVEPPPSNVVPIRKGTVA